MARRGMSKRGERDDDDDDVDVELEPPVARTSPGQQNGGSSQADELARLKRLLFGKEAQRLAYLEKALSTGRLTPADVSAVLPEAVRHTVAKDDRLGKALAPTLESAIQSSVTRNPKRLADALFPVLGPAIRKSIAAAMSGMVDNFNAALENSLSIRSLKWRWEARRTGRTFAEVVLAHTLVYRVEQVLLIHREQGVLLCHVVAPSVQIRDPDLVSAMLTAISDFVADSFGDEDGDEPVAEVKFGSRTLHVAAGPYAVLAAVVAGKALPTLAESLATTVEQVHMEAALELSEFRGDADVFRAVKPLLEECLDEQRKERKRSPLVWLVWLAILGTAGWFGWQAWQERQRVEAVWQGGLSALRQAPGVVVLDVDRDGDRVRIAGLRDPEARAPAEILAAAGLDPSTLDLEFETYSSLDHDFVEARMRRLLDVPGAPFLRLVGDVVEAQGHATHAWIERASILAPTIPGVTRLDRTALVDTDRRELESAWTRLAALRFHFTEGTDVIEPHPVDDAEIALTLSWLDTQTALAGSFARIVIQGRAVPTEQDTVGDLGRRRASAAARRLEELLPEATGYDIVADVDPGDPEAWGGRADRMVHMKVKLLGVGRR